MDMRRRRNHRHAILNLVEEEIKNQKQKQDGNEADIALWKGKNSCFRRKFITKETWEQIRTTKPTMEGYKEIWFTHATPRYAFLTWLVIKDRIATGEKMLKWNQNVNSSCVFCNHPVETRNHLFFSCEYSKNVWKNLVIGLLSDKFSENWQEIMKIFKGNEIDKTRGFLLKYVFQNSIHSIWNERNKRRHGENPSQPERLIKLIDKNVRNLLNTMSGNGASKYKDGIKDWFASRI